MCGWYINRLNERIEPEACLTYISYYILYGIDVALMHKVKANSSHSHLHVSIVSNRIAISCLFLQGEYLMILEYM